MCMSNPSFPSNQGNTKKLIIASIVLVLIFVILFAFHQNRINKQVAAYEIHLIQTKARFEHYHLKSFKNDYITIIDQYQSALDSKDLSLLKECQESLDTIETEVLTANTKKVEKKLKKLRNADTSHAYETELKHIETIKAKIEQYLESKQFTSITPLLKEWTDILNNMSFVADNLSISVSQIDIKSFPNINLYLSIQDIGTNETPAYLQEDYLYLMEGKTVLSVNDMEQLEDNEAVLMRIVMNTTLLEADMSTALKENLDTFSNKMDKNIGDTFEIASDFSTSLLYDNLINELENLNTSDTSVKCLVVITDAEDTESTHTWEEAVELANQYQIPVFIIGVGKEVSPYILERISTRTNGAYRNIHDFKDVSKVLEKIYAKQKAIYKVEYVSELEEFPDTPYQLHIAYQHRLYGGECDYEYSSVIQ